MKKIEHDEIVEDVYFTEDGEGQRTNPEIAMEDWLSEVGGMANVEIRVFRDASTETHGKQPFLFTFSPEDYSMGTLFAELRDKYGTGSYWVKAYSDARRLIFNKRVAVENIEKDKLDRDAKSPYSATNSNNEMMRFFTEMQQKTDEKFTALLLAMAQGNRSALPAPAVNPTEMMGGIMGIMLQLKELSGGDNQGKSQMELITQGMELASKFASGDKETNTQDTMLELVKTFGAPLVEAMKNTPTAQPVVSSEIEAKQKLDQQENQIDVMFRIQTNALLERAKKGSDPELYADVLLDSIPNLVLLLNNKPIGEVLIKYNPEIANHSEWFERLNAAIYNPYDEDSISKMSPDLTKDVELTENSNIADITSGVTIENEEEIPN